MEQEDRTNVSVGGEMRGFQVHEMVGTWKRLVIAKEISTIKGNLVCYRTIRKEPCGQNPIE